MRPHVCEPCWDADAKCARTEKNGISSPTSVCLTSSNIFLSAEWDVSESWNINHRAQIYNNDTDHIHQHHKYYLHHHIDTVAKQSHLRTKSTIMKCIGQSSLVTLCIVLYMNGECSVPCMLNYFIDHQWETESNNIRTCSDMGYAMNFQNLIERRYG